MKLRGSLCKIYISIGTQQELFFYVSISLSLGDETIEVVIMCGRRPGENNKYQGHDRVHQF